MTDIVKNMINPGHLAIHAKPAKINAKQIIFIFCVRINLNAISDTRMYNGSVKHLLNYKLNAVQMQIVLQQQ